MIYNGKEVKNFGFGLMRLPVIDGEIDIEQTKQMTDLFLENGFTYFDTAYGYMNQKSEVAAKICLVDRYPRESFQLATKLPAWNGCKTAEDARQMFYTSLERTGAGYFDFYLLHNIGGERVNVFEDFDLWNFIIEQKELGKIKKIGFSMHDSAETLDKLLTAHPQVDFVQLQINYADWQDMTIQSEKCYEVALKHNKPVIIMEPIRGGALANPPQNVKDVFDNSGIKKEYSHWALGYAASLDNAIMVLSGMTTLEQMQQNVEFMKDFTKFNEEEQVVVNKAMEVIKTIPSIPCTGCAYCVKNCPQNIPIPDLLGAMNKKLVYGDAVGAVQTYNWTTRAGNKASTCIACGLCESVCPQFIKIIDELVTITNELENA